MQSSFEVHLGAWVPSGHVCACGTCPRPRHGDVGTSVPTGELKLMQYEHWAATLRKFDNKLARAHTWCGKRKVIDFLARILAGITNQPTLRLVAKHYGFRPTCDGNHMMVFTKSWPAKAPQPNFWVAWYPIERSWTTPLSYAHAVATGIIEAGKGFYRARGFAPWDFRRVGSRSDYSSCLIRYIDELDLWARGMAVLCDGVVVTCGPCHHRPEPTFDVSRHIIDHEFDYNIGVPYRPPSYNPAPSSDLHYLAVPSGRPLTGGLSDIPFDDDHLSERRRWARHLVDGTDLAATKKRIVVARMLGFPIGSIDFTNAIIRYVNDVTVAETRWDLPSILDYSNDELYQSIHQRLNTAMGAILDTDLGARPSIDDVD